jgi:amino acid adenylation domain-containing protein
MMSQPTNEVKTIPRCPVEPTNPFNRFDKSEIEQSIPNRFEQIVSDYPDQLAVKTESQRVTYDALNRAANRLAHAILSRPEKRPEPVALFVDHGVPLIIANLAVLKAGNISLRMDPSAPQPRILHLLQDSQATLIVADNKNRSIAREWAKGERELINMDELDSSLSDGNPGVSISPSAFAYIRYTSGSTGQAKGGLRSHRQVLHAVMNCTNYFHICADDRLPLLRRSQLGKHIFAALLNGAALYPFDVKEHGLVHLADWLIQEEITIYESFTTAFRHFVSTLSGKETFPKLRLIRLEGEPVYKRDVELFRKHFSSQCLFVNSFSSTETGTVCFYFVDKDTEITGSRVPVGYPAEGMQVLLLDESGREVGFDQPGEIAVKSRFLSSGYWQRPELTQEKFLSEPDGGEEHLYLTGDLGQMSNDGCVEHLGRKDFQVKIRGFRVDIGEVEAMLVDHPGIKQAAVVAGEDQSGDTKLVAYVVPNTPSAPTVSNLRHFLREKLPDYMIPSTFVKMDEIPLTATGKINRRALPDPDNARPDLDTIYVAPQTPTEKAVTKIWAEILCLDRVGIHDDFLELGGHSLAATRVVSQVINVFRVGLPVQSLLQAPTVADMATAVLLAKIKEIGQEDIERMLIELESLSDEAARRLAEEN